MLMPLLWPQIRVYCRVRPNSNGSSSLKCSGDGSGLSISVDGKDHAMDFDKVFPQTTSQEEVFNGVSELVQSALDGYHVCLFSYGQTGAGKTYTMQGTNTPSGRGIIPRAVEKILQTAASLQDQEWEYHMEASFIEIYNNQLKDLLGGPHAPFINDQNAIKHDANGGHTTVVGISRVRGRGNALKTPHFLTSPVMSNAGPDQGFSIRWRARPEGSASKEL
jgi:kinesin family protein C1